MKNKNGFYVDNFLLLAYMKDRKKINYVKSVFILKEDILRECQKLF